MNYEDPAAQIENIQRTMPRKAQRKLPGVEDLTKTPLAEIT
jgi:hypothetical protein